MCFLGEGATSSSLHSTSLRYHALLLVHPRRWVKRWLSSLIIYKSIYKIYIITMSLISSSWSSMDIEALSFGCMAKPFHKKLDSLFWYILVQNPFTSLSFFNLNDQSFRFFFGLASWVNLHQTRQREKARDLSAKRAGVFTVLKTETLEMLIR